MARKSATITIDLPGRDIGKVFLLTEMSAMKAEKWAARALLVLARSNMQIPEGITSAGMAGIAVIGIHALAGVEFAQAEPLLDEMLQCVEFIPDAARPMVKRHLMEDDIEEVRTYVRLREEVLSLHVGFSIGELRSQAMAGSSGPNTQNTAISPAP